MSEKNTIKLLSIIIAVLYFYIFGLSRQNDQFKEEYRKLYIECKLNPREKQWFILLKIVS